MKLVEFNASVPADRLQRARMVNRVHDSLLSSKLLEGVKLRQSSATFPPPGGKEEVTEYCLIGRFFSRADDVCDMMLELANYLEEEAIAVYYPLLGEGEMVGPACIAEDGSYDPSRMDWKFDIQYFQCYDNLPTPALLREQAL